MESGRNTLQVVGAACLGSLISVDQEQDRWTTFDGVLSQSCPQGFSSVYRPHEDH